MNLALTDEQEMLREAAADALGRLDTVAGARAALDGEPLPDIWPTAIDAGWTGLLVPEEHGGAGLGPFDAMLVQEECGRRLTGAGLLGHVLASHLLTREGADADVLGALAAGDVRAAYAPIAPPRPGAAWTAHDPAGPTDGDAPAFHRGRVQGAVGFIPDAAGADVLLVGAVEEGEPLAVRVDPAGAGVDVERVVRCDASRPLAHVRLEGAAAEVVARGEDALARTWYVGQGLLAADALGVCQSVLDMAVEYAKDRHTFGRPIGSYQAVKHQLVEILRRVDKIRNLTYFTGLAVESRPEDLALAASSARFAAEEGIDYATRTCIAVHGGIGATWEHDAPLFWRRAQLSRLLLGGGAGAGDRVAEEIVTRARALPAAA